MARVRRLVAAGWVVAGAHGGGRYVILVRRGARRVVVDVYWGTAWSLPLGRIGHGSRKSAGGSVERPKADA